MRKDYIADKLAIDKDLDGLSLKMTMEHFKLYEGYVKKSNEIQTKLEAADKTEANGVYSYIGELKRHYGADGHNVGAVWGAIPLIALDIYEHAYVMDYGVNRKDYIASFFKNLDWNYVNGVVKKFAFAEKHGA